MNDPSVERFRLLDLDDAPAAQPAVADDGPGRKLIIDDPDEVDARDRERMTLIAPKAGEVVNVAGVAGWYGSGAGPKKGRKAIGSRAWGDTFFTFGTSGTYDIDGVERRNEASGIAGYAGEGATARARRLGGIAWETKLVPATRADGGDVDVARYYVVRKDNGKALGLVGKTAAQLGKGDPTAIIDPAPTLLQPAALDILDDIGEFKIAQGGCIGGTVPWVQADPVEIELNGLKMLIRPLVRNPLDGKGSMALALPTGCLDCRNLYVALFSDRRGVFRFRHCESGSRAFNVLRDELRKQVAPDGAKLKERIARLKSTWSVKVSTKLLEEKLLPEIFGYEPGRASELGRVKAPRLERWMDAYNNAPGAQPGTVGGVLQATSYVTSHAWTSSKPVADDSQLWQGTAGAFQEQTLAVVQRVVTAA